MTTATTEAGPVMVPPHAGRVYSRLGSISDVRRALDAAQSAGFMTSSSKSSGTARAWTVTDDRGEVTIFRALCKGGNIWVCIYTRGFWAE